MGEQEHLYKVQMFFPDDTLIWEGIYKKNDFHSSSAVAGRALHDVARTYPGACIQGSFRLEVTLEND